MVVQWGKAKPRVLIERGRRELAPWGELTPVFRKKQWSNIMTGEGRRGGGRRENHYNINLKNGKNLRVMERG